MEKVYRPAWAAYEQYGAPRVKHGVDMGQQQWEKTVKPLLDDAQARVGKQYDALLGPYIKQAQDKVQPHYDSLKTSATDIWELELRPVYQHSAPYLQKLYTQGHRFALDTALPQVRYAGAAAWRLWARQIWPRIRILYGENVEPQLMRIKERLGRYKDGRKLEAEVKSMEMSSSFAEGSSTAAAAASSMSSVASAAAKTPSSAISSATETGDLETTLKPAEQFRADLQAWEEICSKATEEGADHLKERITDITADLVSSQINGTGGALITQLEETALGAISSVKAHILSVVGSLPEYADSDAENDANEQLTQAIRSAGQTVKHAAQAVRDWKHQFNAELDELVEQATESTLETIDSIRELRLQEIGRKYSDKGLTHKDWSKYNDVKKTTATWRNKVRNVSGDSNSDVKKAKEAADDVESKGMSIAEECAKELVRLKAVAKWKVASGDCTDDFNTKYTPPTLKKMKYAVDDAASSVSEAILGPSDPIEKSVESATSHMRDQASKMADYASGSAESMRNNGYAAAADVSERNPIKDGAEKANKSVKSAVSAASESVFGTESSLADRLTEAVSQASETILGSETPAASSIYSKFSNQALSSSRTLGSKAASILAAAKSRKDAASQSASSIVGTTDPKTHETPASILDHVSSSLSSAADAVSSFEVNMADDSSSTHSSIASEDSDSLPRSDDVAEASSTANKVFAGAMAEVLVEAREPILDDIVDDRATYSINVQSMVDAAGDLAGQLTEAVEEAFRAAPTSQGTIERMTTLASEQYESAIAAASSVLFGTEYVGLRSDGAVRKIYQSAVAAASQAIHGTSAKVEAESSLPSVVDEMGSQFQSATDYAVAAARSHYDAALSQASSHLEAAKSLISVQVSGTPEPMNNKMFASAESAYSEAVEAAGSNYKTALAGSPFAYSIQDAYGSISRIASERLAEGLKAASAQYQSAKIMVGAEPTPVHQQYLMSAQAAYYQAVGLAHDRYSSFLQEASNAVGATPTPAYQAYLAAAQSTYSTALAAVSSNMEKLVSSASHHIPNVMGGTGESPSEQALESISSVYNDAIAIASSQLAVASSQASEMFYGSEKGIYGQATEAAASAYTDAVSRVSEAAYGTETPWAEAIASQASGNWEALISRASKQVYGEPPPFTEAVMSQVGVYAAQATSAAQNQFEAVHALFSEIISGKEPDFTESVMSRLRSAYATGAPAMVSSASSMASEAYASATAGLGSMFTPPASLDSLVAQMQEQLDAAVDAASAQFYGRSEGNIKSVTEAAASVYSDAGSQVSKAIYGQETGYAQAVQASLSAIGASASSALSEAIYGKSSGKVEAASASAVSVYSSLTSAASVEAASISSAISSAVYGEEKEYVERMNAQIQEAVASAQSRIAVFGDGATQTAAEMVSQASAAVMGAASSVSSIAKEMTEKVRDEL